MELHHQHGTSVFLQKTLEILLELGIDRQLQVFAFFWFFDTERFDQSPTVVHLNLKTARLPAQITFIISLQSFSSQPIGLPITVELQRVYLLLTHGANKTCQVRGGLPVGILALGTRLN